MIAIQNVEVLYADTALSYIKEIDCGLYTGIACILVSFKFNPTLGKL